MATNDVILIDGILEDITHPTDKGEKFELFAIEQILKDYELSNDELQNGIVDGRNDGGIDGLFYFVNDKNTSDIASIENVKSNIDLTVYVITCKHEMSFNQTPLNALSSTIDEFFDLTKENNELIAEYNEDLLSKRTLFKQIYFKVARKLTNFTIKLIYTSRGSSDEVADNVLSKSEYLKNNLSKKFSSCSVLFDYIGSSELLIMYRKKKQFCSDLNYTEIIHGENSYIILANLKEYYKFIIDEDKKLKRYFFDSNVRSYMGDNRVNTDIFNTLANVNSPEFWFLNNGITVLSDKVTVVGKNIQIENVQIVNGLQTSETIYKFFSQLDDDIAETRNVLIKIITSNDKITRDEIIKSTNNQTNVDLYALKATDKIQRDIEELLLKHDIYYERRTNYYLNQGIEKDKIITPLYLAYGFLSLILKNPYKASSFKSKFMNKEHQYKAIFSEKINIKVWPIIAKVLKKVDNILLDNKEKWKITKSTFKFLKNTRSLVSFLSVSEVFNKFNFSIEELVSLDLDKLTDNLVIEICEFIFEKESQTHLYKNKKDCLHIISEFANLKNILDFEKIEHDRTKYIFKIEKFKLTEEFLQQVKKLLPPQPWGKGTHTITAKKLGEPPSKVSQAIQKLINRGELYQQKKGLLYDKDGSIVDTKSSS